MADISRVKLPSGNYYDIKDAVARQMIAGGIGFVIAWTASDYASSSVDPSHGDIIPAGVTVYYNNGASTYTGDLAPSSDTKGKFYLIYSKTQSGTLDVFDEYTTVENGSSYFWEKIGDTQIDLSNVVTDVTLNKSTETVITDDNQPYLADKSVKVKTNGVTDEVLGKQTLFTVTDPTITATPSQTYIQATATGASVSSNTRYLSATAAGTAVGADGTASAVVGYENLTTDTFVKSVSAETGKKLVTTSITPTDGTETVSKVTKTTSKLVTTSIPNVTGNTDVSIPNVTNVGTASTWSFTMGSGVESETLIIGGANSTTPTLGASLAASKVTLGTNITAATGSVAVNGSGADVITGVVISDKTVAKAGTAVTVATGATASDGSGDEIVTGVTIGTTASAITSLGNPTTSTVLTGVKVTTQPTVTLSVNTATATGRVEYLQSLGTITQPTISLATNSSSATGRVQVMTGITSISASGTNVSAITSGSHQDVVTVYTSLPTYEVNSGSVYFDNQGVAEVLTSSTSITVSKGG